MICIYTHTLYSHALSPFGCIIGATAGEGEGEGEGGGRLMTTMEDVECSSCDWNLS